MSPSSAPSPRAASSPLSGSAATSDRSLTVFVSYAREDGDACARVRKDLGAGDLTVTGDWDLQRGEEYQQQLVSLIQRADVVVALISPDFARSEACRDEIDQAVAYGKRILPMIVRDLPDANVLPVALRSPQWTFLRSTDEHDASLPHIRAALFTDVAELRKHRELLQAAERWAADQQEPALLFRDAPLADATGWLARARARDPRWLPQPTNTQIHFIEESHQAAGRRRLRNRSVACVVLIAASLGAWAIGRSYREATREQQERVRQEQINEANRLAREAAAIGTDYRSDVELRVLLAVKSLTIAATAEADRVIRESLALLPGRQTTTTLQPGEEFATFSDDSRFMATTRPDRSVHLYDTGGMRPVATVRATADIRQVVISGDNRTVALSRDDGYDLFDLESGNGKGQYRVVREPATPAGQGSAAARRIHVALSPTAEYVAFADGKSVTVSRAPERPVIATTVESDVNEVAFSADGRMVVVRAIALSVHDVATGRTLFSDSNVGAFAFSPDGRHAVLHYRTGSVELIELGTGRHVARTPVLDVRSLAFNRAGTWIAAVLPNGVSVLSASDLTTHPTIQTETGSATFATFTHDGSAIAMTNDRRGTRVWDLADGQIRAAIWDDGDTLTLAPTAAGEVMVVNKPPASANADAVRQTTVTKVRVPTPLRLPYRADHDLYGVAYSRSSRRVAIAHGDGRIGVYDAATGELLTTLHREGKVTGLTFARGDAILSAASEDRVDVFDIGSRKVLRSIETGSEPGWASMDARGTVIAVSAPNRTVRIHDAGTGQLMRTFPQTADLEFFVLDPTGTKLGISTAEHRARVYDAATGRELATLTHTDTVSNAMFSDDGSLFATASDDYTTQLWDLKANAQLPTLGRPERPWYAAFSPTGGRLATSDNDGKLRLYAPLAGTLSHVIAARDETIPFFVDDDHLLTMWQVGDKLEIREHALQPADVIAGACGLLTRDFDLSERNQYFGDQARRPTCPGNR